MQRDRAACAAVLCLIIASAVWQVARDARVRIQISYDYDEGVYAATADAVARGGRLYRDVFLSQPPGLVLAIRETFALFGTSLAAARGTIVLAAAVWLVAVLGALWARGSPWGGAFAVLLLLGSGAFLTMAHTLLMEVPSEALAAAAVATAAWGTRRLERGWWIASGAFAALAVMTKLTAVTCVIPLAGAAMAEGGPRGARRWAMMAAGGVLVAGAFVPVIGTRGFLDQVFTFHVALLRTLSVRPWVNGAMIVRFLAEQWPLSAAAALGLSWSISRGGPLERALIAWLIADCGLLIGLAPLWDHHLTILMSPLAFLAGIAAVSAGGPAARLRPEVRLGAGAVLAAAALGHALAAASAIPAPASSADLTRVVSRISTAVPVNGMIVSDDPMVAFLARRPLAAGLIDTSLTRIWAGEITQARVEASLRDERTEAAVFWRGTFRQYFPPLGAVAEALFPIVVRAADGRLLLLKKPGIR